MSEVIGGTGPVEPEDARRRGAGPLRVLLVAALGALLVGFAGFAVSSSISPQKPIVETMCVESNCTFAMSADSAGSRGAAPPPARHRSAPERVVNEILHICHVRQAALLPHHTEP